MIRISNANRCNVIKTVVESMATNFWDTSMVFSVVVEKCCNDKNKQH